MDRQSRRQRADTESLEMLAFWSGKSDRTGAGGKKIKVTYTADTISGFGGLKWELMAEGSSLIIRPAAWIRKIKAASEVIEEMGE